MPCPLFEPLVVVTRSEFPGARLPLLEEYDGNCRATGSPIPAPAELRFRCCNHGYSAGCCPNLPAQETRSAIRFDVTARNAEMLCVLYVEEQDHSPLLWRTIRYSIAEDTLIPELPSASAQAQARAFCLSFLRRFAV